MGIRCSSYLWREFLFSGSVYFCSQTTACRGLEYLPIRSGRQLHCILGFDSLLSVCLWQWEALYSCWCQAFRPLGVAFCHWIPILCCREFQTDYLLCDCNILWMHQWLKERNITVRETKCAYPKSLQSQSVTGVKQELLTCGKHSWQLILVF